MNQLYLIERRERINGLWNDWLPYHGGPDLGSLSEDGAVTISQSWNRLMPDQVEYRPAIYARITTNTLEKQP